MLFSILTPEKSEREQTEEQVAQQDQECFTQFQAGCSFMETEDGKHQWHLTDEGNSKATQSNAFVSQLRKHDHRERIVTEGIKREV